jgi:IS4 transposase
MTNQGSGHLRKYGYRREIESGYRSIKRFMTATTSKDLGLQFFYFTFACLLSRSGELSICSCRLS